MPSFVSPGTTRAGVNTPGIDTSLVRAQTIATASPFRGPCTITTGRESFTSPADSTHDSTHQTAPGDNASPATVTERRQAMTAELPLAPAKRDREPAARRGRMRPRPAPSLGQHHCTPAATGRQQVALPNAHPVLGSYCRPRRCCGDRAEQTQRLGAGVRHQPPGVALPLPQDKPAVRATLR